MTNNDILRRLRYTFNFDDAKMIKLFAMSEKQVTRAMVSDWLKKEEDKAYLEISDLELATFLNALIVEKRGKREGPSPKPESYLTNNMILRKLKIALDFKSHDIIDVFGLMDAKIGEHELSALLRNPKQSQYRACNDQYLRVFLGGLQKKYRNQ